MVGDYNAYLGYTNNPTTKPCEMCKCLTCKSGLMGNEPCLYGTNCESCSVNNYYRANTQIPNCDGYKSIFNN